MSGTATLIAGLTAIATIMLVVWFFSVFMRNVSIVDLFWGPVIAAAGVAYWLPLAAPSARATIVLTLVTLWAARLAAHLYRRNAGKPEDRRYADMRERNDPAFWVKSLYLVFGLQAVVAWVVSFPLYGATIGSAPLNLIDYAGIVLVIGGLLWESIADWQLARFLAARSNSAAVMNQGLWRYSRHPNYFGEFCIWWGFFVLAAATGSWWTIISPIVLSFFLLKVSGVTMLEKDIGGRRPEYQHYIRTTNAFFPGPPRD